MNYFDYLIVGNSAGAVGCVEGLRTIDKTCTIGLISEETHHVYSRALIPYFLDGKIDQEKMLYRPIDFYERNGVTLLAGAKAENIDFNNKQVVLSNGERPGYEKLLLATGGKPFFPPISGLDKQNVFSFHSFDDVLAIENMLDSARHAVILGGGVIGLMAAEVLKKRGLHVYVLELADRVLAPVIDETASRLVERVFQDAGVEVFLNNSIASVDGQESAVSVTLMDGKVLPCDLIIVGVGVAPRVELVEGSEVEVNRGIVVNKRMQTSVPDVYACGDCTLNYNFVTGGTQPLPLWPNAYLGGRIAAFNMLGTAREYTAGTSMNAMHFFDLNLINAGLNVPDNNPEYTIIKHLDEKNMVYRKFVLDGDGVIKGFILAGQIARAGIFLNLMRRRVPVGGFQQELLRNNFGYGKLPGDLRWRLLKDEVILGVI